MAGHFIFVLLAAAEMTVRDIEEIIEGWAPKEIAWEKDNTGLQVGSPGAVVRTILICLDVTEAVIREAVGQNADLIISHHPLLFRPLRALSAHDSTGRCLHMLMRSGINLFATHTNMDFARNGTSFALADSLGLINVDFLLKNFKLQRKIVTFVPPSSAERVAAAMARAGAGRIGNYEMCSFRSQGTGSFKGNERSSPAIGVKGKLEHTDEVRLEMRADEPDIREVVQSLLQSHPYEEVAYDVYPLDNVSSGFGMGVIGEVPRTMSSAQFTNHVQKRLQAGGVRATRTGPRRVRRVAVCGGSGSDLLGEAIRQGAQAFVTADVKYHSFHEAHGRILLIDAGHYETEWPLVPFLARRLKKELRRRRLRLRVRAARTSSNPIAYN